MGYLKPQDTDLHKLPSNPEYWVRLRLRAPWGVHNVSHSAMLNVTATSGENNGNGEPNAKVITKAEWSAYIQALVRGFITEWNLTDENDKPLPITDASLELLDEDDGAFLSDIVQERSKLRPKGKNGTFVPPSRRQSSNSRR